MKGVLELKELLELIKKIKVLQDSCDLIGISLYGYNQALDDVIELLERCEFTLEQVREMELEKFPESTTKTDYETDK